MDDIFVTVAGRGTSEIKERGSRFLGLALPVRSVDEISEELEQVRRQLHDARHHCYAYRLGHPRGEYRSYDDGEPAGTAGPPILQQIESRDLTNTLVIVTRYFGGRKLGRGGLARAYSDAASRSLDSAGREQHTICVRHRARFGYDDTAAAMHVIEAAGGRVTRSEYSDVTTLVVEVRRSASDEFVNRFVDQLGGRGEIRVLED